MFEHIERCHRQEILPCINGFWFELLGYLVRISKTEDLNSDNLRLRVLYRLLMGLEGIVENDDSQSTPEIDPEMRQRAISVLEAIRDNPRAEKDNWHINPVTLPPVERVDEKELERWIRNMPDDYLKKLLCRGLEMEELYLDYFVEYEPPGNGTQIDFDYL